jgi:TolB-like protein/lipopolysaccharide biosynthesis regulator YciM
MSSIIEGYNYDIFISYRQKDNKYDGWVTEFVDNLKKELEATFKEEISVYFDINPSDGLLETDSVDKSIVNKLSCLIFIPIISRTYCDPKSYAWQHEFCAFNTIAKDDQFGRDIRLANGNVTSRILPIKIHDIDPDDKILLENELGGVLRSVEFIYMSSGVNRPLRANEDHPQDNQDKTYYRDQINKVAIAIKEIIKALKKKSLHIDEVSKKDSEEKISHQKNVKAIIIAGSLILFALVVSGYFIIPKLFKSNEQIEKSIAVLPFINESPVDSNKYFINGIMEEVLNNLQTIKEFRVLSRTSTDQYQGSNKPTITEIAKKLGVNFIVEGSGQKYGNNFRLRVQLIRAKGKEAHLWGQSYEAEINDTKDIFNIQNQIAQTIAAELKTVITPEEKQLIEKPSTGNLTAYDLYQRGVHEYEKNVETSSPEALERAEEMFNRALEYDSTFAKAYVYLAKVYWKKHFWKEYFSTNFLDSVLFLANTAIKLDDKLADAYTIRGRYFQARGLSEQAVKEFDEAIKYNPNDYEAYYYKGRAVRTYEDYVIGLDNLEKAIKRDRGKGLATRLQALAYYYADIGFSEKAKYYYKEAFTLDGDSSSYLGALSYIEISQGNFEKALELAKEAWKIDTTRLISIENYYFLPSSYDEEAYQNAQKWINYFRKNQSIPTSFSHRIGYALLKMGKKAEAQYYFDQQIRYDEEIINLSRNLLNWGAAYYDLAATYAILGDKEKTYKYLNEWNNRKVYPLWWVVYLKNEPFFDKYRNEERFQKIVNDVESKYNAEHERVRKWLEENNML